ncbi:LacI family transcriptional regulator, partial [Undibacterium sp. CY18W]|nr:LacI family transcriptional regulator [Undibacterium hunanense]
AHGRTQTDKPYAWFDYDNANGIRLAVQHLLALGHQRISLISAGLDIDTRYLIQDALDRRSGHLAVQQLLNCTPRPSAIIVDN